MSANTTASSGRAQWKQEQQLLEAQRAGDAAPDTDEDGNAINPHIPQFMSDAPWYTDYGHKTLKHQRKIESQQSKELTSGMDQVFTRGQVRGPAATKFRKGACENCGSMTHKKRDCVERPRKLGAKITGKDIRADDVTQDIKMTFDAKRDRWNGVVLDTVQAEVREKHDLIEMKRAHVVAQKTRETIMKHYNLKEQDLRDAEKAIQTRVTPPTTTDTPSAPINRDNVLDHRQQILDSVDTLKKGGSEKSAAALKTALEQLLKIIPQSQGGLADDETVAEIYEAEDRGGEDDGAEGYADQLASKVDTGGVRDGVESRVTARKMRIREDVAKYLLNLSTDPQYYYDGKTRSMRANPFPDQNPDEVDYAGDNWARSTGDSTTVDKMQAFCWNATQRLQDAGHDAKYINMTANPTQAELAFKRDQETKERLKDEKENAILKEYGGTEYLQAMPDELKFSHENFVEYRPDGTLLKGAEAAIPTSKYVEDVYTNGHTSVWGSYWTAGQWGFSCCKSTVRNSLCVSGSKDDAAKTESKEETEEDKQARLMEEEMEALEKQMLLDSTEKTEAEEQEAKRKQQKAKSKETEAVSRKRKALIDEVAASGRRLDVSELQLMGGGMEITEEHLREYKRQRVNPEDPMAKFSDEEN